MTTITRKVQPRILERGGIAYNMTGGLMVALGAGWDVEFRQSERKVRKRL